MKFRISIHHEGHGFITMLAILAIIFTLGCLALGGGLVGWSLSAVLWVFTALCVFFFRDPERQTPMEKISSFHRQTAALLALTKLTKVNSFMAACGE